MQIRILLILIINVFFITACNSSEEDKVIHQVHHELDTLIRENIADFEADRSIDINIEEKSDKVELIADQMINSGIDEVEINGKVLKLITEKIKASDSQLDHIIS